MASPSKFMALQEGLLDPDEGDSPRFELWKEMKQQLHIAGPVFLICALNLAIPISSVIFVGQLGKLSLASFGLANSACYMTGLPVLNGMSTALETLCGQAYGAKQYSLVGVYLQRAVFVLLLTSIPFSILWFYIGDVLRAVGQDHIISSYAQEYSRLMIPNLFGSAFLWPLQTFLQMQSIVVPSAIMSFIATGVHFSLCWILVFVFHFGAKGVALSVSISCWVNVLLLMLYVRFSPRYKKTFTGITAKALADFKEYFKLTIPATAMICLESWALGLITILSGLVPNPQLETSAAAVISNVLTICSLVPLGLRGAASTRVSNELGAGHSVVAKSAVAVVMTMTVTISVITVTVCLAFGTNIGWAFTSDIDVVHHIAYLLKVLIFITACYPIETVLGGIIRGCGLQDVGAFLNFISFYVVGLPTSITLAFVLGLHGKGLWIGLLCGNLMQTVTHSLVVLCMNWKKQAENAKERITKSSLISKKEDRP